ncbi:MAG: hypothetical protein BMS9Abin01_2016 [Gammaproteobacteria bacterium]|nr:MAG: hypothetical protein BMS9Abin01_2016 [Gammaproteobacteria bacterium]
MDWEKLFKKYLWDESRTPYLTSVADLTKSQANFELFAFSLFLGTLFTVVAIASLTNAPYIGRAQGVSIYAFTIVCGAILLGATRHYLAALYCATAPIGALLYFYVFGFHPNLGAVDHVVILVVIVIWLRYSLRIISIGKRYSDMP